MAVIMLRRRYNAIQWASLFLLGIGVAAVQLGAHATPHATHSASESNNISSAHPTEEHSFLDADQLLGLSAVVISCFASAIAATYFELILKKTPAPDLPISNKYQSLQTQDTTSIQHPPPLVPLHWRSSTSSTWDKIRNLLPKSSSSENAEPTSLWIRNVQLSLFSLIFSWWLSWWSSANATASGDSFFAGFNVFTWVVILIQTIGGLLTGRCSFTLVRVSLILIFSAGDQVRRQRSERLRAFGISSPHFRPQYSFLRLPVNSANVVRCSDRSSDRLLFRMPRSSCGYASQPQSKILTYTTFLAR